MFLWAEKRPEEGGRMFWDLPAPGPGGKHASSSSTRGGGGALWEIWSLLGACCVTLGEPLAPSGPVSSAQ